MNSIKHQIYEAAVQSPKWQVDYLFKFSESLTGKKPKYLREDFSGSALISCHWVQKSKANHATALDLNDEALHHAKMNRSQILSVTEQERLEIIKQNVLKPTKPVFDLIGAFNYSFFTFHTRKELKKYFLSAYKSLKKSGTLFLEMAGGPDFISPKSETNECKVKSVGKVKYIWEHHQFDPITQVNDYSLHFLLPAGKVLSDAFTYHWRIWNIREVRELLEEVGFKKSVVLWQKRDSKNKPTNEFKILENAETQSQWLAYVVGVK